jgi:hypothetical protein
MAQRVEPHDSLDDFPTPPWAGRALFEHVLIGDPVGTVWEPACNRGFLARGLNCYTNDLILSDVHDYGIGAQTIDFLFPGAIPVKRPQIIATNPPFRLALQFIIRAQELSENTVAMFVRTSFAESVGRYNDLFKNNPPHIIAHFAERVIIAKGVCRDPAVKYWCEKKKKWKKPSTATSYSWMVWKSCKANRTDTVWIPPCRKSLERPGDYEVPGQ